jgi:hypothetical protein
MPEFLLSAYTRHFIFTRQTRHPTGLSFSENPDKIFLLLHPDFVPCSEIFQSKVFNTAPGMAENYLITIPIPPSQKLQNGLLLSVREWQSVCQVREQLTFPVRLAPGNSRR